MKIKNEIFSLFPSRAIRECLEPISGWDFTEPSLEIWTNWNSFTRSQGSHICLRYHTGWRYDEVTHLLICML